VSDGTRTRDRLDPNQASDLQVQLGSGNSTTRRPTPTPERRVIRSAVHGGYWRRPYEIRSTLAYTALPGLPKSYAPVLRIRSRDER
jgi:hypothetical protein